MKIQSSLLVLVATGVNSFTLPSASVSTRQAMPKLNAETALRFSPDEEDMFSSADLASFDPLDLSTDEFGNSSESQASARAVAITAITAIAASPLAANAAGPDWGIFEGRTLSLLHPTVMLSMLAFSISTALLGFQWRRQRTLGDEISAMKKTLPNLNGASSVSAALATAESAEEVDSMYVSKLKAALPLQKEVDDLVSERKELASQGNRDKHFNQGSLLLFVGIAFAIEGPLNTYARAGKLFPGPHLYAGAGLVVLWALAASMVPAMQKGNDTARSVHIGANAAGIGLFLWQVTSGIPIAFKVIEFTKFP